MFVKYNYILYLDKLNEWNLKRQDGQININLVELSYSETFTYYVMWSNTKITPSGSKFSEPQWYKESNKLEVARLPGDSVHLYILDSEKELHIPADVIVR